MKVPPRRERLRYRKIQGIVIVVLGFLYLCFLCYVAYDPFILGP